MGKETLRALGREALRTGGKILADIDENPQTKTQDIVSKHVTDDAEYNKKLRVAGGGRRKTARQRRKLQGGGGGLKRDRKRVTNKKVSKNMKRDIFS